MKKAFTLIEVMIAVMIFFIVSIALLNIVKNNKKLIQLANERKIFALKSSIAFLEKDAPNNYERLIDYNITNDEIIKDLKKDKIKIDILKDEYNMSDTNFTAVIKELKA